MKQFRIHIDTPYAGTDPVIEFEMPDDATEAEIAEEAREQFLNLYNYSVEPVAEAEAD